MFRFVPYKVVCNFSITSSLSCMESLLFEFYYPRRLFFFIGFSILTISASDNDDSTSENGQVEYNLVSGNVGGRFELDKNTGELLVSQGAVFDFQTQNLYIMQVREIFRLTFLIKELLTIHVCIQPWLKVYFHPT